MVAKNSQDQPKDQIQDKEKDQQEPDHEERGFQEDEQYFHGTEFHRWIGR